MRVIVVGCGRLGAELATRLFQAGHDVSIIDRDSRAFAKLPENFEGRVNEGEAIDRDVLRRAGIERADTVAVVTDSDVMNAAVAHLVQSHYKISNVVVRNHDPVYRPILEAFGLQAVSAMSWGAQRVEELLYDRDAHAVFSAGNGEVEIYEVAVPDSWSGSTIGELIASEECVPVSVTRAGRAILPSNNMALSDGDVLHVSATQKGMEGLRKRLRSRQA
jgi:trk system potassium uptake protein TrkA